MNHPPSRLVTWLKEAKRRRLFMPVVAYTAVAVTIIELSDAIFEALLLPDWGARLVTVLLILGFPVVIVLAWVFDVTPEGVRKTEGADGEERVPDSDRRATKRTAASPPTVRRIASDSRSGAVKARPGTPPNDGPATATEPGDESDRSGPPDPERVKRAALGHVRHELKTPINGILGYSQMLIEDLPQDEDGNGEIRADLERIRAAGDKLLTLVDEILSPARIDGSGNLDLDDYDAQIRADLRNPINAVVGYAELLKETSLEEGRDHLVPDLERIETAARRLLELSTDIVQVATTRPTLPTEGDRLGEASALTQELLAKARPRSLGPSEDGRGSLLVVDDNAMNRDLLSRQLARAGYVVQTAKGGEEALELLGQRSFDLILLDVIMPGVDGLEVLRRIKSDGSTARIPVMMLSSLDDVESAIRCIELGAEDFLHKPFHPTLLQARIGSALKIRRMRDEEARQRARLDESEAFAHRLLRSTFPPSIAERIRAGESEIVESFDEATVLWCDVDGAARSHARDAAQVAGRIQRLLEAVERMAEEHVLETLAPAGDGVVVVAGVPIPDEDHAQRVAAAAHSLTAALMADGDFDAPIRVGVDSGEVTAGVMGAERQTYRLWGDPVDLARSLGGQAKHGQVMVSPGTYRLLKDRWAFATPGVQEIPERGQMKTYILEGPA